MARFSFTATRGEVTGRPERPPDKFLGPRSQRVGFEKVIRPKGGEARISESRECNRKAAVGREHNLKVQTVWVADKVFAARKQTLRSGDIVTRLHRI